MWKSWPYWVRLLFFFFWKSRVDQFRRVKDETRRFEKSIFHLRSNEQITLSSNGVFFYIPSLSLACLFLLDIWSYINQTIRKSNVKKYDPAQYRCALARDERSTLRWSFDMWKSSKSTSKYIDQPFNSFRQNHDSSDTTLLD